MNPLPGVWQFVKLHAARLSLAILSAAILLGLYGWRLASIPRNFSADEIAAKKSSMSLEAVFNDPINLPHKLLQLILQSLGHQGPLAMRSVSVFFIFIAVICFYVLINWWFDRRIAVLATAAFAVSPSVVIAARTATSTSLMICGLSALMAGFLWVESARKFELTALIVLTAIVALGLYIPGMAWIILVGALFFTKRIFIQAKDYNKFLPYILLLILCAFCAPLFWAVAYKPALGRELLLLPGHFAPLLETVKSIAWTGLGFIWRTRDNLPTTLGYQPVFDVFALVLAAFGVFHLMVQYNRRRTYSILGIIIIAVAAAGVQADFMISSLAISAMYVLVAAGMAYLFSEWFSIFPRNPIARYLALCVVVAALSLHVLYGVRYSLFAWPRAPETKAVYVLQ